MRRVGEGAPGRAERSASPSVSMCWRAALALRRVFPSGLPTRFGPVSFGWTGKSSGMTVDRETVEPAPPRYAAQQWAMYRGDVNRGLKPTPYVPAECGFDRSKASTSSCSRAFGPGGKARGHGSRGGRPRPRTARREGLCRPTEGGRGSDGAARDPGPRRHPPRSGPGRAVPLDLPFPVGLGPFAGQSSMRSRRTERSPPPCHQAEIAGRSSWRRFHLDGWIPENSPIYVKTAQFY